MAVGMNTVDSILGDPFGVGDSFGEVKLLILSYAFSRPTNVVNHSGVAKKKKKKKYSNSAWPLCTESPSLL